MSKNLPESKPMPAKSCDTCGASHIYCKTISGEHYCADWQKKEPENNCGNCNQNCIRPQMTLCHNKHLWQPKAAEPQSWEQRYCNEICGECGTSGKACYTPARADACQEIAFIRAEIERVREEEKQAVIWFVKNYSYPKNGMFDILLDILNNNGHRGKK